MYVRVKIYVCERRMCVCERMNDVLTEQSLIAGGGKLLLAPEKPVADL